MRCVNAICLATGFLIWDGGGIKTTVAISAVRELRYLARPLGV